MSILPAQWGRRGRGPSAHGVHFLSKYPFLSKTGVQTQANFISTRRGIRLASVASLDTGQGTRPHGEVRECLIILVALESIRTTHSLVTRLATQRRSQAVFGVSTQRRLTGSSPRRTFHCCQEGRVFLLKGLPFPVSTCPVSPRFCFRLFTWLTRIVGTPEHFVATLQSIRVLLHISEPLSCLIITFDVSSSDFQSA
jgi:hypothetical protein